MSSKFRKTSRNSLKGLVVIFGFAIIASRLTDWTSRIFHAINVLSAIERIVLFTWCSCQSGTKISPRKLNLRRTTTRGPRDRKIPSSSRQPPPPCLPTLGAIEQLLTRALNKYQLAIIEEFNQPLFRSSRPRALNSYKWNIKGSNSSSWRMRKRGECTNVLVAGTYIMMLMRIAVLNANISTG